jgi:hypothetical protein
LKRERSRNKPDGNHRALVRFLRSPLLAALQHVLGAGPNSGSSAETALATRARESHEQHNTAFSQHTHLLVVHAKTTVGEGQQENLSTGETNI